MKYWLFMKVKGFAPNFAFRRSIAEILLVHIKPEDFMDHWSVQPFNGQLSRHRTILKIIEDFRPTACIETGTYRGTSTPYLASYSEAPVFTIEIDHATYAKTKIRHKSNYSNLQIQNILGDSANEIEVILKNLNPEKDRVFAYLDAHWLDAIPTKSELESLVKWGGSWVAVIDDFQVPGDSGYSFDKYGSVIIGTSQIPSNTEIRTFVPSVPSKIETGPKRGTGYTFFGNSLASLSPSTLNLLREI